MNQGLFRSWKKYVHNLEEVLQSMQEQQIIAVGVAPYPRIIPSLFLPRKSYQIFCVKDSSDLDVLRTYANIICLEDRFPKVAAKVNGTGWLVKNFSFQQFLNSRKQPFRLIFYQTTKQIVDFLEENQINWIGNDPKTFEKVLHKETFRKVLRKLNLTSLPDWTLSKPEFASKTFDHFFRKWQKPIVCQPGDLEVIGSTYFIRSQNDLEKTQKIYTYDTKFSKVNTVKLTPLIEGDSLSMLGCVLEEGVLTSPLQTQLIDIPESLHGFSSTGTFFGHDWGIRPWSDSTEVDAQVVVEIMGDWLRKRGYKGIFGIDFIYDNEKGNLYPLECNPRFTGAIPVYSMINISAGVPPIDFFTLASYLRIPLDMDFDAVNETWKRKISASHIGLTPLGINKMQLNFPSGIYKYLPENNAMKYLRPGAFLHELKDEEEFILIDQVPRFGQTISQTVPRLFKIIFPVSIAESSHKIKPVYGKILSAISNALRKNTE